MGRYDIGGGSWVGSNGNGGQQPGKQPGKQPGRPRDSYSHAATVGLLPYDVDRNRIDLRDNRADLRDNRVDFRDNRVDLRDNRVDLRGLSEQHRRDARDQHQGRDQHRHRIDAFDGREFEDSDEDEDEEDG